MKVLLINDNMHFKNLNALRKYKKIEFHIINHYNLDNIDLTQFDVVYSPCGPIDVRKYPHVHFLFGPHFSIFPKENQMALIRGCNTIFTTPSDWTKTLWQNNPHCHGIRFETLPFGVDTERFNEIVPRENRDRVFIYYKARDPNDLELIRQFVKIYMLDVTVFSYHSKYKESDYIDCLQHAKFGIWIGSHESQGFALEEALSCNVPLLVWNVTSMNQEYRSNYDNIMATSIPYWDHRCGEYFYHAHELQTAFNRFIENLPNYKPRDYILENISIEKCEQKCIDLIHNGDFIESIK